MFTPTVDELISVMLRKSYHVYSNEALEWNLNIVGIRSNNLIPDMFDDTLAVFYRFMGDWHISYYPITTDPSTHYLRNPIVNSGTAILKEGQYTGVYMLGIHKRGRPGAHRALCQKNGDVQVYRDNNKDGRLNMENNTVETGMFHINIHKGPRAGRGEPHNDIYSAGCQVFADDRHFAEFIYKCEMAAEGLGNRFTYTLLNRSDFG